LYDEYCVAKKNLEEYRQNNEHYDALQNENEHLHSLLQAQPDNTNHQQRLAVIQEQLNQQISFSQQKYQDLVDILDHATCTFLNTITSTYMHHKQELMMLIHEQYTYQYQQSIHDHYDRYRRLIKHTQQNT
jgi:hypothetical protein